MAIPNHLNHYTILEPLGRGGMGEVYLAEDNRLHRRVAIKVLSGLMATDPEQRLRFEREAHAVAALNHPNIVTLHSVEEADGVPFLTMELVDGQPLAAMIPPTGMALEALLRIAIAVSDAMSAAHQRGITHRDLKPANVMVTHDGRVKVLDFGLAKLQPSALAADSQTLSGPGGLTMEGRIIGTVAYMSPEQAEGKPVDPRSDIFSLGVVLYEMTTGSRPFSGDSNVAVISSILKDTPKSVSDSHPGLPHGIAKIIRRCLAKDPSRRYQTATDLRNELEELKQETDSGVATSVPRVVPVARRWPGRRTAISLAVALILAAGAAATYRWRATTLPPFRGFELDHFTRLTTDGASRSVLSGDGRYVVYVKPGATGAGLWVRQVATASDVQIVPPAPVRFNGLTLSTDGNFVYYVTFQRTGGIGTLYRVPVLGGTPQKLIEDIDSAVTFSPDGQQMAFMHNRPATGRNALILANTTGGGARDLATLEPPDTFELRVVAWSPDGATILAVAQTPGQEGRQSIVAVDVATGAARNILGRWSYVESLQWMPDGRSFVVSATELDGKPLQLWQVTVPDGQRRRITNDLNGYDGVSVSADGRSIAATQVETVSNIWVVPVDNPGGATQTTAGRGRQDGLYGLDWTPDGRIVFSSTVSGEIQIWIMNADGSNPRQLSFDATPVGYPVVTADGRFVVYSRVERGRRILRRAALDGSNARDLATTSDADLSARAAVVVAGVDPKWVYYNTLVSGGPRPFKISIDGGDPELLADTYFQPMDISRDGRQLLGFGWDSKAGRSWLATMPTGGGRATLLGVQVGSAKWAPDGRSVTTVDLRDNALNIWMEDLQGGRRRQVTRFPTSAERIIQYSWSADDERLALARASTSSDSVRLTAK